MADNGNGQTHRWSSQELDFLLDHASDSGPELVEAFRNKFPDFEGTDQSILGRRYTLLHKATDIGTRKRALEHRIEGTKEILRSLEEEYAELVAEEQIAEEAAEEEEETEEAQLEALGINDLRAIAKARGLRIKPSTSKREIVRRLAG